MVMNTDQSKKITGICNKKKINLFIVKQNRYNPAIKKLKEAIDQKKIW